jgi:hypothetical protein
MDFDYNDVSKRASNAEINKKYWEKDDNASRYSINKSQTLKS